MPVSSATLAQNVKVTNFLIFCFVDKEVEAQTGLCDGAPHYAPLNAQLFSVCLNRKGHTGSCQHAKGHVISNKGAHMIRKATEWRVKLR